MTVEIDDKLVSLLIREEALVQPYYLGISNSISFETDSDSEANSTSFKSNSDDNIEEFSMEGEVAGLPNMVGTGA